MEENEMLVEQNEEIENALAPEIMKEIEDKVKELRAEDKKMKGVFPVVVEGNPEYGEKEIMIAYFRTPTFTAYSKYLTVMQKDQLVAMRTLAKDCFLAGDRVVVDDDDLFLYGLMPQLSKILEFRQSRLVNLSKPGK